MERGGPGGGGLVGLFFSVGGLWESAGFSHLFSCCLGFLYCIAMLYIIFAPLMLAPFDCPAMYFPRLLYGDCCCQVGSRYENTIRYN